jgi:formate hydrogenlyase subunit 3/multisubunit Na+/H+ antiporter MnhD subunit
MNPLIPIIVLLFGAALTAGGAFGPRGLRGLASILPMAITLLALLVTLAMGLRLPAEATVSDWGPKTLFRSGLTLRVDLISWLLSSAMLLAALAAFLTGLSRPGGTRLGARTASLLITAAALAAIQAQNLITFAITWAALDILYFVVLILLAQGEGLETQAVLSLGLNSVATFLVVAAALDTLHSSQESFLLGASPLTERAVLLLFIAVVFRLGVFPFHLGLLFEANIRQGLGTLLKLAPVAVALNVLAHVMLLSPDLPLRPWLSVGAVLGLLVSAAQWWDLADPRQGLSYVVLAHSSLALLTALWGGPAAAGGVLALGLALVLGGAAMFLHNGYNDSERGWVAASVLGASVLVGLPLTVGFIAASTLYRGLAESGSWVLLVACVIGQLLLAASYLRLAFWPGEPIPKEEPLVSVAYLFGLALPLLFALIFGAAIGVIGSAVKASLPDLLSLENASGLGAVLVAVIGGVGLWQFENLVRARADTTLTAVTSAARLDWLYVFFWDMYRFAGRSLRTMAAIIEGEGGVLWTIVAVLLVWLLFRGR